jgi:hypothetical protein
LVKRIVATVRHALLEKITGRAVVGKTLGRAQNVQMALSQKSGNVETTRLALSANLVLNMRKYAISVPPASTRTQRAQRNVLLVKPALPATCVLDAPVKVLANALLAAMVLTKVHQKIGTVDA